MNNAYRWSCVSSEVTWSPRDGAQLVSFEDKLFLLGGGTSTPVDGPTSPVPAPARSSRRCARRCGARRIMAATGP